MSTKTKLYIVSFAALALVAGFVIRHQLREAALPEVRIETVERRDLTSEVMASGEILPKRSVNISADTVGRVTRLAVEEGEEVKAGQFLLQIDPEALESAVEQGEAGIQAAREALNTARVGIEGARASWELAEQNLKRMLSLYEDELISREVLDQAEKEVEVRESELRARELSARAADQRLKQEIAALRSARHYLSRVTIESPMDGVITQLNIREGETVLVGTMNNPGTVLMTIADLSVIQAELEVDETDIVDLHLGLEAAVRIDALPEREFKGRITKIGSSALRSRNPFQSSTLQAANFEVIVTLEDEVPNARPGFSCSAVITTGTSHAALAVPIQALTSRSVEEGFEMGPESLSSENGDHDVSRNAALSQEIEGAFVVKDGTAFFTPIRVGLAGQRSFEVLAGLQEGDQVIVGPFSEVRELTHGSRVRIADPGEALSTLDSGRR